MSNLTSLFSGIQEHHKALLARGRAASDHSTTRGTSAEKAWIKLLREFLPRRYQVGSGIVMDSRDCRSEQIVLIIYDHQYTPMLQDEDEQRTVPAESVYAVLEVKQQLQGHLQVAGQKAASVRQLHRTSTRIRHASGEFEAREPFRILAGLLAYTGGWMADPAVPLISGLGKLRPTHRLDLISAADVFSLEVRYGDDQPALQWNAGELPLFSFLLRLVARLQALGAVPAIDFKEYAELAS